MVYRWYCAKSFAIETVMDSIVGTRDSTVLTKKFFRSTLVKLFDLFRISLL